MDSNDGDGGALMMRIAVQMKMVGLLVVLMMVAMVMLMMTMMLMVVIMVTTSTTGVQYRPGFETYVRTVHVRNHVLLTKK